MHRGRGRAGFAAVPRILTKKRKVEEYWEEKRGKGEERERKKRKRRTSDEGVDEEEGGIGGKSENNKRKKIVDLKNDTRQLYQPPSSRPNESIVRSVSVVNVKHKS